MQQLQNLQSSYFKDTRICVEVDKVDRTAADDGVASHALPFLLRRRATREQRATLCLSLSYTASSPSEDRFDVKHFFLMTIPVVALLQQLFLHFVWQCFQSFESQFFSKYFSTANDLAFGSSPIKVKIS